eukprot:285426-Ditylum_brightwellii.AAC.1
MRKIVKYKLVDEAEGMFDLVEALLEGDALTHWLVFEQMYIKTGEVRLGLATCEEIYIAASRRMEKHPPDR